MSIFSWVRRRFQFDAPTSGPIDRIISTDMYGTSVSPAVSRLEALSVPSVQRGRNMICSIATLPLVQHGPDWSIAPNSLLDQIDPDVANVVTLSQTIEDLVFEGVAWWRILAFGWDGYPVQARRVDPGSVSLTPPVGRSLAPLPSGLDPRSGAVVYIDGEAVDGRNIIRFDSPNPAVLKVDGRAIKRAIRLDQASGMYADNPTPLDYFSPAEGADPITDAEALGHISAWRAARRKRATAWVPLAMKYNTVSAPSPRELQLVELGKQATLDIANALGVDPEDLGVSTTSRTYSNAVDRRVDRVNDVYSPYMLAITQRLSMADVTRRGYRVSFLLDDYMKSNPTERWATYNTAKTLGVLGPDEIREREHLGPRPAGDVGSDDQAAPADVAPIDQADPTAVAASQAPVFAFDAAGRTFVNVPVEQFAVDSAKRTIEGLAVPWGTYATKYGLKLRFDKAALQWSDVSRVKLTDEHGKAVGVATVLKVTAAGLFAKFRVQRGPEGDAVLMSAEDGVKDGLSIGVDFDLAKDTVPDPRDKTATLVRRADLREVAATAIPAFDDARVTRVEASAQTGGTMQPDQPTPDTTPADPTPVAPTAPTAPAAPAPGLVGFSGDQLAAILARPNGLQALTLLQTPAAVAVEPRGIVDPTRPFSNTAVTQVTDPTSYRFDRRGTLHPGAFDFGMDLVAAAKSRRPDSPEYLRVMEFARAQFDVVTTNVDELNPTIQQNRYVDQREFVYPMWDAVNRGAPPNGVQPFGWPSFSSAGSLVAAHSEGTDPSSGTYVTTTAPVTPTALSGKAKISREVWDMGGTPGLGDLIWRRITRDWYENLEAAVATVLDAASPTALNTFTAGGGTGGATLAAELKAGMSLLPFLRGGFRFDIGFANASLYAHLAAAIAADGRAIFPAIGPTNADGTIDARFASMNVNGVPFVPAWGLGATVGTAVDSSYLIDRTAVDGWATPPQRIDIQDIEVANVYIGVWGYKAVAINDLAGVREIAYDPVP